VAGLCNLYSLQNTISIIKIGQLRWVWLEVLMAGNTTVGRDLFINTVREREDFKELGADGK
jgi:chorismate-pyruvate lyase